MALQRQVLQQKMFSQKSALGQAQVNLCWRLAHLLLGLSWRHCSGTRFTSLRVILAYFWTWPPAEIQQKGTSSPQNWAACRLVEKSLLLRDLCGPISGLVCAETLWWDNLATAGLAWRFWKRTTNPKHEPSQGGRSDKFSSWGTDCL